MPIDKRIRETLKLKTKEIETKIYIIYKINISYKILHVQNPRKC